MTQTLFELLGALPARERLEGWWNAPIGTLDAHGVPASALPVFAVWLARRARRPVLAMVPDPEGGPALSTCRSHHDRDRDDTDCGVNGFYRAGSNFREDGTSIGW